MQVADDYVAFDYEALNKALNEALFIKKNYIKTYELNFVYFVIVGYKDYIF